MDSHPDPGRQGHGKEVHEKMERDGLGWVILFILLLIIMIVIFI